MTYTRPDDIPPVPEHLRAEGAVLTDSLIPLVNQFRARQAADGTVPRPDGADRALLRRIRDEGAAWCRRHALDGQAAALEADVDGWLAAGLDTRPAFGRSADAVPRPAAGETVFLLAPARDAGGAPPAGDRLDCLFALRAPDGFSVLVTVAGSEGFAAGARPEPFAEPARRGAAAS
ncbi:hypothetical protein [Streptomyces showdoensis]|uniref:hypothetical protein n=1 Tax=Streptomyces showdoensis TaxID=68268 RepID=UPI000F512D89|nr:hypothetical protein [Streptomyces showdoensis]